MYKREKNKIFTSYRRFKFLPLFLSKQDQLYWCRWAAHLLQDSSAFPGCGQVSQEGEGQHLDGAIVWSDPWGQLHDRVHQRAPVGPFGSCSAGAAATQRTASWNEGKGCWHYSGRKSHYKPGVLSPPHVMPPRSESSCVMTTSWQEQRLLSFNIQPDETHSNVISGLKVINEEPSALWGWTHSVNSIIVCLQQVSNVASVEAAAEGAATLSSQEVTAVCARCVFGSSKFDSSHLKSSFAAFISVFKFANTPAGVANAVVKEGKERKKILASMTLEPPHLDDCILSIGLKTKLAVKPVAKVTKIRNALYLNVLQSCVQR